MAPLLPKHLLSTSKKETAAIVALWSIHACAVMVVDNGDREGYLRSRDYLTTPFLSCQLGLLAWWACLTGPRRFWRVILSVTMFGLLIAFALRQMIPTLRYVHEASDGAFTPNEQLLWIFYFGYESGFVTLTAPFVFAFLAVIGWLVPCKMTRQRHQSDATDSGPPDRVLSEWQFGVGDLLAGTAAIAAVTGLIAWIQPYPTWILEYGYYAVVHTWGLGLFLIPLVLTVVPATWFSGYFLLAQTIRPRYLAILVLLATMNCVPNVLINDVIAPVAYGMGESVLVPSDIGAMIGITFLHWIILGSSFFLLRMAGFRITRARSRVLRHCSTSE